jgi:hypothetical protein
MPEMQTPPRKGGVAVATENQSDSRTAYTEASLPLQDIFDSLPLPAGRVLRWLLERGVAFDTLYMVKGGWVRFHRDGTRFDLDPNGEHALIFRCEDRGETIDLAAWCDNKLATWRHAAFALGDLDQCFNPAVWFDGGGLRIHAGPLDWLRAGGAGIVILRSELCWAHLRHVPRVICADERMAEKVHRWTEPPRRTLKIFVQGTAEKEIAA